MVRCGHHLRRQLICELGDGQGTGSQQVDNPQTQRLGERFQAFRTLRRGFLILLHRFDRELSLTGRTRLSPLRINIPVVPQASKRSVSMWIHGTPMRLSIFPDIDLPRSIRLAWILDPLIHSTEFRGVVNYRESCQNS